MPPVPAASEVESTLLRRIVRRLVETVDPERVCVFIRERVELDV